MGNGRQRSEASFAPERYASPSLINLGEQAATDFETIGHGNQLEAALTLGEEALSVGGADEEVYEKVFIANTHASLALTVASVELTVDGTSGNIVDFDLENTVNGSGTVGNRLTAPTVGQTERDTWSDAILGVPGGTLGDRTTGTADHIGVWLQLDLDAGTAPEEVQITLQTTGTSV